MSWNVVSNSNILRVNSFNYRKMKNELPILPKSHENFAPQLLEYMNDIFTALDAAQTGYITVEDLERYWKANERGYDMFLTSHYGISSGSVINCMQQITPDNGMFNFRKFIRGVKMAVSNAKNDRLRNLSSGNLKGRERSKSLGKPANSTKPPRPDIKPDHRLFGRVPSRGNNENKSEYNQAPKRALQERQFNFCEQADEESLNETKELSISLDRSNFEIDSGIRKPSARDLFPSNGRYKNLPGNSFEVDSFISQSDTIDYTQGINNTSDSCNTSVDIPRAFTKVAKNEDMISKLREIPRRSSDPRYRAFRKTDLDRLVDQVSEKIRMMQKCMDATENAREWYTKKISILQQDRMELRRLVFLGKGKEETEAKVDKMKTSWQALKYDDVKRNMSLVSYYNEQMQKMAKGKISQNVDASVGDRNIPEGGATTSPLKPTTKLILEKIVEGQSRQIKQLENEKAALVRDVFLMKGKLNVVEKPIDQVVPF